MIGKNPSAVRPPRSKFFSAIAALSRGEKGRGWLRPERIIRRKVARRVLIIKSLRDVGGNGGVHQTIEEKKPYKGSGREWFEKKKILRRNFKAAGCIWERFKTKRKEINLEGSTPLIALGSVPLRQELKGNKRMFACPGRRGLF